MAMLWSTILAPNCTQLLWKSNMIWLVDKYSVVGKYSVASNLLEWVEETWKPRDRTFSSKNISWFIASALSFNKYIHIPEHHIWTNSSTMDKTMAILSGKKGPNPTLHQFDIATLCSDDLSFEYGMVAIQISGFLSLFSLLRYWRYYNGWKHPGLFQVNGSPCDDGAEIVIAGTQKPWRTATVCWHW